MNFAARNMKIIFCKSANNEHVQNAFALTELLVVLIALGILATIQVAASSSAKDQTRFAVCGSNIRQLAFASQIFATENLDNLPVLSGAASWPWDLPDSAAQVMLSAGCQKKTFYCPGTQPRYTDWENFLDPGSRRNLWDYGAPSFHITGYSYAFSGSASKLAAVYQNKTMLPERVSSVLVSPAERVLIADAILSGNNVLPATPADNFINVAGGFYKVHTSPHVVGQMPVGYNLAFKDGHVSWRRFDASSANAANNTTQVRTTSGPWFWW